MGSSDTGLIQSAAGAWGYAVFFTIQDQPGYRDHFMTSEKCSIMFWYEIDK